MTRAEHLAWCKERALRYLDELTDTNNAISTALTSLFSDLTKHPDTVEHPGMKLVATAFLAGLIPTREEARRQIEGFN